MESGAAWASAALAMRSDATRPVSECQLTSRLIASNRLAVIDDRNNQGQSIVLPCSLEPSADMSISWIRGTADLQLLTYDSDTIIQDDRFKVRSLAAMGQQGAAPPGAGPNNQRGAAAGDWALQIKNLDKNSDAGIYQCQLNSEPPQSQFFQLNIVEPQVSIAGAPDLVVRLGAPLNLSCLVSQSPDQFQYIFWHKDDRVIGFDLLKQTDRGKVVISRSTHRPHTVVSNLLLYEARASDSGNYSCRLSSAQPAHVLVHVLEGDESGARWGSMKMPNGFQSDGQFHTDNNNELEPESQHSQHPISPQASTKQNQGPAHSSAAPALRMGVRVSGKRLLAMAAALLILHSWLQLVLQIQTAISLLLLAIIGCFIGKLSSGQSGGPGSSGAGRRQAASESSCSPSSKQPIMFLDELKGTPSASNNSKSNSLNESSYKEDEDTITDFTGSPADCGASSGTVSCGGDGQSHSCSSKSHGQRTAPTACRKPDGEEQPLLRQHQARGPGSPTLDSRHTCSSPSPNTALLIDPVLLRRANSALNLLRGLAEVSASLSQSSGHQHPSSGPSHVDEPRAGSRSSSGDQSQSSSGHHSLELNSYELERTATIESQTSGSSQTRGATQRDPDSAAYTRSQLSSACSGRPLALDSPPQHQDGQSPPSRFTFGAPTFCCASPAQKQTDLDAHLNGLWSGSQCGSEIELGSGQQETALTQLMQRLVPNHNHVRQQVTSHQTNNTGNNQQEGEEPHYITPISALRLTEPSSQNCLLAHDHDQRMDHDYDS